MINRFKENFFTNIKKYFIVKKENKKDNSIENKIIMLKSKFSYVILFKPKKLAPAIAGIDK